jgi:hypothetical protein
MGDSARPRIENDEERADVRREAHRSDERDDERMGHGDRESTPLG